MIQVLPDPETVAAAAATAVVERAAAAVRESGRFTLALAGGSTPQRLYELLATAHRAEVPWSRTHLFWGDERCVPPDHPGSNYGRVRATLLDRVSVRPDAVHRVRGELPPERAAADYERRLAAFFERAQPPPGDVGSEGGHDSRREGGSEGGSVAVSDLPRPTLDLVLLGMGEDGHTASLVPGQVEPDDPRWARAVRAPAGVAPRDRVTLTLRALNAADHAIFLVTGRSKRAVMDRVRAAAAGEAVDALPPAARVRTRTRPLWLVDRHAAG